MSTLKKIALIGGIIGLFIAGVAEANTVYNAPALFETSLATAITANATSATLSYGVLRDGTILNGPVCFTIDSGLSTTEFVCGNASGTVITNLIRGMGEDGSSTYPAISYPHRYGADVKVTDFPVLQQLLNFVQGLFSFPNVLSYSGLSTSTIGANANNIASVGYVNSVAVAGAPNASVSVKGISQLSTQAQMAAHTALGSTGASLVDQTANDSLVASTSPVGVVASGTLDPSFLLNGNYSLGSTTIATGTFPNQTSSLLITNASGTLGGISTSSLLAGYAQVSRTYLSVSTTTAGTSASTTLLSTGLPAATTSTIYHITIDANNGSSNSATTTITLDGTTLFNCRSQFSNPTYHFDFNLIMANSTSSEYLTGVSNGCSSSGGAASNNATSSIISATASIAMNTTSTNPLIVYTVTQTGSTATTIYSEYNF